LVTNFEEEGKVTSYLTLLEVGESLNFAFGYRYTYHTNFQKVLSFELITSSQVMTLAKIHFF